MRTDSSPSFNAAVKHFFRHLHDAHALLKNPVVRHLFKGASPGAASIQDQRATLMRIHQLVRQGAKDCYDADVARGEGHRAFRQLTIVTRQCLERRPIKEVAAALGISHQSCYRERADICRRVASYVFEHADPPVLEYLAELDEFRFLVGHLRHRAVFEDQKSALLACEKLVSAAESTLQRIEALYAGALLSLTFDGGAHANAALIAAQELVGGTAREAGPSQEAARAYVELMGSSIAYYRGNTAEALRLAQEATARLRPLQSSAPPSVRELYTESLFKLAMAFWSTGDTEMGSNSLNRCEKSLRHVPGIAITLRSRIVASLWKLRNYLLLRCESWYPSRERLAGLAAAFEQAYANGSLAEAVETLVIITEHHVFGGNDDEALRAGRCALMLAKQQRSDQVRTRTAIEIGTRLLPTRHWQYASSLISGALESATLDAYHRELLAYFAAERALRLRDFRHAWGLATDESTDSSGYWATLRIRKQLVAAAAAHGLGRGREARALVERAVSQAENLSLAPILGDAYRIASGITGDARLKRKARDVQRLLTA